MERSGIASLGVAVSLLLFASAFVWFARGFMGFELDRQIDDLEFRFTGLDQPLCPGERYDPAQGVWVGEERSVKLQMRSRRHRVQNIPCYGAVLRIVRAETGEPVREQSVHSLTGQVEPMAWRDTHVGGMGNIHDVPDAPGRYRIEWVMAGVTRASREFEVVEGGACGPSMLPCGSTDDLPEPGGAASPRVGIRLHWDPETRTLRGIVSLTADEPVTVTRVLLLDRDSTGTRRWQASHGPMKVPARTEADLPFAPPGELAASLPLDLEAVVELAGVAQPLHFRDSVVPARALPVSGQLAPWKGQPHSRAMDRGSWIAFCSG